MKSSASEPGLRSRIRAEQKQNRDYLESLCISQKNISNTFTVLQLQLLYVCQVSKHRDFLVRQARQFPQPQSQNYN